MRAEKSKIIATPEDTSTAAPFMELPRSFLHALKPTINIIQTRLRQEHYSGNMVGGIVQQV